MREILFRGKTSGGIWMYGYYEKYCDMHKIRECDGGKGYYVGFAEEETIGEFTGLYDKNGVKIFEGDIVKIYTKNPTIAQVVFSVENGFLFEIIKYIDKSMIGERVKRTDFRCNIVDFYDKGIEVIGNIYDNPELLED